jgi:hypothetical protein
MQQMQQMQMGGAGGAAPPDSSGLFKSEKEFLELANCEFRLRGIESLVLEKYASLRSADSHGGESKKEL